MQISCTVKFYAEKKRFIALLQVDQFVCFASVINNLSIQPEFLNKFIAGIGNSIKSLIWWKNFLLIRTSLELLYLN